MSVIGKAFESGRKRARTEDDAAKSTSAVSKKYAKAPSKVDASTILRANKIFSKLSTLLKEFPELKFILEFENLQAQLETAVVEYVEEKETKKYEAQLLMNYNKEAVPLHSLPDEVLKNCLSYVGKGHYGVVGLVSKKLNEAYKEEFGQKTAYLEMATSVKLANHCLNELCKNLEEKDELIKAAAVNGNLDILRAAVKDGYDLFPLVALEKTTVYPDLDEDENGAYYDPEEYFEPFDVYYTEDDKKQSSWGPQKVNLAKLVERGHLHVLKYLHEELHYFLGLHRYIKPAIEHGKLEILEWLESIDILDNYDLRIGYKDNYDLNDKLDFCECAIKSGNVDSLKWLQECYTINNKDSVLGDAINSKSIEMIQYCFDLGYDNLNIYAVEEAIKKTKSVEVFRLLHELGYEFGEMKRWHDKYDMKDYFEIIKFLRSISIPWNDNIMNEIVEYGTMEMIQFAHEDGCPWTGKEFGHLLGTRWSMDKFKYLIDNGCKFDYEKSSGLTWGLRRKKELVLLDYFVGKNSSFDNKLFKEILDYDGTWFEGISYLLEKGKDVQNFKSIEEVLHTNHKIDGIKYFHRLGLPWCLDSSRNTYLLSKIACYNNLEDVKWAYENGCRGGYLVPFVKDEWKENGIRHSSSWKANSVFFQENGLLNEFFLEKSGLNKLDSYNVEEIGDAQLGSLHMSRKSSFFRVNFCSLKNLVDYGYTFSSESEKESVCEEAYKKCCANSHNEEDRKRLALFLVMGVRDDDD
ncbi:hypothetical protein CTEN210_17752 [Chaetoceros tenuissimus]|uniref:F-box domain-containing protein n=1 Tax=Chaetoceros tenuissimus TaxID=426638 RepID=A0AAD3HFD7_9STRA|nr:hypothetical protein CTEN210_17752 [Chaetoceros tenuissimus]